MDFQLRCMFRPSGAPKTLFQARLKPFCGALIDWSRYRAGLILSMWTLAGLLLWRFISPSGFWKFFTVKILRHMCFMFYACCCCPFPPCTSGRPHLKKKFRQVSKRVFHRQNIEISVWEKQTRFPLYSRYHLTSLSLAPDLRSVDCQKYF